ncbi:MAG: phosphohistidine phosphatase SixA [Chromatiaceae bacterium]|nr:phosphohistidine phosphatase SixA [Chromatiaceae bacterium]
MSEQGRQDVRHLAHFLRNAGTQVEHVIHSGKTRAEQTAAILAELLLTTDQPQAHAGLGPKDPLEIISPDIAYWSEDTLIVGHLPFLGRFASLLIASDPDRPLLAFQPGSMACLEKDADGRWLLAWMIRPELLAADRL